MYVCIYALCIFCRYICRFNLQFYSAYLTCRLFSVLIGVYALEIKDGYVLNYCQCIQELPLPNTPLKINGWNLEITHLQRKIIFHPPPLLCSSRYFSRMYVALISRSSLYDGIPYFTSLVSLCQRFFKNK